MPLNPLPSILDTDVVSDVTSCDEAMSDISEATGGGLEEEERCRQLFSAFDANGDGFLDRSDLERMCRELSLDEQSAPLILSQLGADDQGRISCADFMRAWLGLRAEVDRLRLQPLALPVRTVLEATTAADRAGIDTPGDCVSWSSGVTSGDPHDPALRSDSLLSLLEQAGHPSVGDPPSILIEADKLHQVSLSALRAELDIIATRLSEATAQNSHLQKSLSKSLRERERAERTAAARLSATEERYEQRLVELHSVIAELSRALQTRRDNVIAEEEEDGTADSNEEQIGDYQEGDSDAGGPGAVVPVEEPSGNKEATLLTEDGAAAAAAGQRESDVLAAPVGEDKACQMTDLSADDTEPPDGAHSPGHAAAALVSPLGLPGGLNPALWLASTDRNIGPRVSASGCEGPLPSRLDLLQQELRLLRRENDRLQEQVGRQEAQLNRSRIATESATERDKLRRKAADGGEWSGDGGTPCSSPRHGPLASPATAAVAAVPLYADHATSSARLGEERAPPVSRLAERIRLKQSSSGVTGSELSACGVQSTRVAEQLVRGYDCDTVLADAGGSCSSRPLEDQLLLCQLEVDRLRARLEHAQAAADVSALALQAARAQADHLAALCGKHESNCVALQMANEQADQLTEAFDVLIALQDSELSLLLASCRAAGLGLTASTRVPAAEAEAAIRAAGEQRRSCESVARHTLSRLDRSRNGDGADEAGSHDASTTSSSSSGVDVDSAKSDESRIRQHIQRLKVARALVARTAVRLESTCARAPSPPPLAPAALHRIDLEHAVLLQELMALREDRAELRSRLFLAERERGGLQIRLAASVAAERAVRLQLSEQRAEAEPPEAAAQTAAGGDCADSISSVGGEVALRSRLRELTAALDEVTRTGDARQQHSDEFIAELKRANSALADALEKTKRKYQAKLKRLEMQMLQIVERHTAQKGGVARGASGAVSAAVEVQQSRSAVLASPPGSPAAAPDSRLMSPLALRRAAGSPTRGDAAPPVPPLAAVGCRLPVMSPAAAARVSSPALARFLSSPPPPPPRGDSPTRRSASHGRAHPGQTGSPTHRGPVRVAPPVPPSSPSRGARMTPSTSPAHRNATGGGRYP